MGLFSKLFKKNKNTDKNEDTIQSSQVEDKNNDDELVESFLSQYNELLSQDRFLSRSAFSSIKEDYKELFNKYNALSSFDKNVGNKKSLSLFIDEYKDIDSDCKLIKKHNDEYINRHLEIDKEYFDCILKKVDSNVVLDDEQRRVCLDDEDYSLIIAGAGAGKTTTLAAKVKYLIDKKGIDPKDILIIAFTNKAVNELKDKITKKLGYPVPISTFHSCGRAIVKKDVNYADTGICNDNFYFIKDYIGKMVSNDNELLSDMIMLFAYYLDLTEDVTKNISLEDHFTLLETSDYSTIKSNIQDYIDSNQKSNSIDDIANANNINMESNTSKNQSNGNYDSIPRINKQEKRKRDVLSTATKVIAGFGSAPE